MSNDDFIGLPPGFIPPPSQPDTDSGTVRRERPERSRGGDIVFFPAPPGAPPAVPHESEPLQPAAPVEAATGQESDAGPGVDDETRISAPRHTARGWRLIVEGLDPVPVEGVLFLGRSPVAAPEHPAARVLAVDDPSKSVSKTHAMLELEDGVLWAHDLDSTNGVWVVPAGQDAIEVTPGTRVAVPAGADLELGDLVIQVEHG